MFFASFPFRDHLTSQRVNLLSQRLHLNSGSWRPDPTTALASKSSALPTGRAHTIWGHTSKVHSGDFLIHAITLTPVFGLWYTRHWNFVLQILCESSLVQNTIMSNYSFYKIVVEHIPSCVLNWKIEKHMSSCGHRHKTTKVKHVRDTQLPTTSLDLTHEVGRTFLCVWNFSSVSSN